ncbi:hypothetical protein Y032_0089g2213 [Ancylostoma ceylanicum]|uniref:Uncharacterized protein n=1 Tax=Ancylostoma ceylanicum TaxID=53326 RepID=A0A016TN30_9BILA|nr:hypothetical protein Y032_0089g2213 [Ancylostoma ceylanicum]
MEYLALFNPNLTELPLVLDRIEVRNASAFESTVLFKISQTIGKSFRLLLVARISARTISRVTTWYTTIIISSHSYQKLSYEAILHFFNHLLDLNFMCAEYRCAIF